MPRRWPSGKVTARILHFYIGSRGDVGNIKIEPDEMTLLLFTVVDTNAASLETRSSAKSEVHLIYFIRLSLNLRIIS